MSSTPSLLHVMSVGSPPSDMPRRGNSFIELTKSTGCVNVAELDVIAPTLAYRENGEGNVGGGGGGGGSTVTTRDLHDYVTCGISESPAL